MNFAICLSRFYISRCDALIKSINKFKKHNIYLLCFDNETYNYFKPKKKIKLLRLFNINTNSFFAIFLLLPFVYWLYIYKHSYKLNYTSYKELKK
jgi:hypothetical protein